MGSNETDEQAVIFVQTRPNSSLITFEVDLNSISQSDSISKDVVVQWKFYDGFTNGDTFWTDGNGLDM